VDIAPQIDAYFSANPTDNRLLKGNKMARERMSIIYDHSAREKALPLGTSNKTELLIGYGTIYGDMASAINPIGDLYKTQLRQLAAHLSVPEDIITKPPTAGLLAGQTDEAEIGFRYEELDLMLYNLIDLRMTPEKAAAQGFDKAALERVLSMIERSEFKRKMPQIAKLSFRTIGHDYLYAYDRGK
jgi:NAD+ synthase